MTLDLHDKIGIAVVLVSLALLYLCWFTDPKGGE